MGRRRTALTRSSWSWRSDANEEKVAELVDKPGSVVDNHSSRPCLAARLKQHTRVRTEPIHSTPIWPCSKWGLPCPAALAPQAVGSYPTISTLPRTNAPSLGPCRSAVYFLLHWPSACAAQALPGTLLYGARTFLGAASRDAVVLTNSAGAIVAYTGRSVCNACARAAPNLRRRRRGRSMN